MAKGLWLAFTAIVAAFAASAAGPAPALAVNDCRLTHADLTVANDPNQAGAVVNYATPTNVGTDPCGAITCSPAAGSFFQLGVTPVTCTGANNGRVRFNITVNDTQPPTLTGPGDITTVTDPGENGAVVAFSPVATDNAPGVTFSCDHKSGELYRVGTTTVQCLARDTTGNTASESFTITVADDEAPSFAAVPPLVALAPVGARSAAVAFPAPLARDNVGVDSVTCSPRSGSRFAIGRSTVRCVASDAAANTASTSFGVTVFGSPAKAPVIEVCGPLRLVRRTLRVCVASDEPAALTGRIRLRAGRLRVSATRRLTRPLAGRRTLRFVLRRRTARRLRAARRRARGKLSVTALGPRGLSSGITVPARLR